MNQLSTLDVSFEFYPPKTAEGVQTLLKSVAELELLVPSFFSMTFGAGGSTRSGTLEMVKQLQARMGTPVAPHISCMGTKREELIEVLHQYQALGLNRIVAIRGDMPSGMGSGSDFKFAGELVSLIREVTRDHFHIEVACYPEVHPQARNAFSDINNLKRKQDAGADSAITQYFFNPDAYFYFIDECARQQITIPIVPGIMPILNFSKLQRFSEHCGAEIPRWLCKRLEVYADDVNAIREFGVEVVQNLCQRLINGGAPGLHFYTLNHSELCTRIVKQLNLKITEPEPA